LNFADRVAYQRAIEEVYWRHRIWPKENAGPKPPLDEVMSQAQIEKKVEDYLRNSQALEDYWQRPITPDQLQAEMERMASHTKQPEVLREIFAVLGNDPFVIAECLARPVLAERLITELYAHDQRFHGELKRRAKGELRTHGSVSQMKRSSGVYTETEWIKSDSTYPVAAGVPPAQPTRLPPHKAADTKSIEAEKMNGSEWQERVEKLAGEFSNAKTRNAWGQIKTGVLSSLQEDDGHYYAVAVMKKGNDQLKLATIAWVKEPLRLWMTKAETQVLLRMAAVNADYTLPLISSASVACTDDTWTATSTINAPAARRRHTAVWTGSEMIVWGGEDQSFNLLSTGGRYNPSTDSWAPTNTTNAPSARYYPTSVWTGSEMIVWGGTTQGSGVGLNTGARYNPGTDSWIATSTTNAPAAREAHTAVWTGIEMIIWGGADDVNFLSTGGRYNPSSNSWAATSIANATSPRAAHTAVWTGSEMIVWGGQPYTNTGGKYNPGSDSWTATSTTNAPSARTTHTTVWSGSEMIVWGGRYQTSSLNTGGRYAASTNSWTTTTTINAPQARYDHTAVWTGTQMIVWGGFVGPLNTSFTNTGGRYCAASGPTPPPAPIASPATYIAVTVSQRTGAA
jgi:N-acetylneuraminic acid mutarotase